jgi:hypothetical protein
VVPVVDASQPTELEGEVPGKALVYEAESATS